MGVQARWVTRIPWVGGSHRVNYMESEEPARFQMCRSHRYRLQQTQNRFQPDRCQDQGCGQQRVRLSRRQTLRSMMSIETDSKCSGSVSSMTHDGYPKMPRSKKEFRGDLAESHVQLDLHAQPGKPNLSATDDLATKHGPLSVIVVELRNLDEVPWMVRGSTGPSPDLLMGVVRFRAEIATAQQASRGSCWIRGTTKTTIHP